MPNERPGGKGLTELAIAKARAALRGGSPDSALTWLEPVPNHERPKTLEAEIRYSAAKLAASKGEWHRCERELESIRRLDPDPFYQRRLALVRRRGTLLDDSMWRTMREKADPRAAPSIRPFDAGGVKCLGLRRVSLQRSGARASVEPLAS